jgi:hypothetical protein
MSANQQVAPTYILPNQLGNYFVTPGGGGGTTATSYYLAENGDFIQIYYQPTVGSPVFVNQVNVATTTTVLSLSDKTKYQTVGVNITNFAGDLTATKTITGSNLALTGTGNTNTINNVYSIGMVNGATSANLGIANNGTYTYLTLGGTDPVSWWYKFNVPQTAPGIGIYGTANNVLGLLTSPDGVNLSFAGNVLTSANLANWANYPAINDVVIGQDASHQHNLYVGNFNHRNYPPYNESFYSCVINANTTIGQASAILNNAPDVSIYPTNFTLGTTVYPARTISMISGAGGTTINSLQGVSINGATDVNMNAIGVASIEGTAGVLVTSPVSVNIAGLLATITTATTQVTSGITDFTNATSFSVLSPLTSITGAVANILPTTTLNMGAIVTTVTGTGNLNIASPLTTITGAVTTNQAVLNNFVGANIAENLTGYHTTNAMTYITQQVGSGGIRTNIDMYPDYLTLANIKGAKLDLRTDANLTADTGNVLVSALGNGNVNVTAVGNGNITIGTGGTGNLILTNPTATTYRATNIKPATIGGSLTIGNIGGNTDSITLNNVANITSVSGMRLSNVAYITNPTLGIAIGSDNGIVNIQATNNELTLNGNTLNMDADTTASLTATSYNITANTTNNGNLDVNGILTADSIVNQGNMSVTGNLNVSGSLTVTGGQSITGTTTFAVPVIFTNSVTQNANGYDTLYNCRTFRINSVSGTSNTGGFTTDTLTATAGVYTNSLYANTGNLQMVSVLGKNQIQGNTTTSGYNYGTEVTNGLYVLNGGMRSETGITSPNMYWQDDILIYAVGTSKKVTLQGSSADGLPAVRCDGGVEVIGNETVSGTLGVTGNTIFTGTTTFNSRAYPTQGLTVTNGALIDRATLTNGMSLVGTANMDTVVITGGSGLSVTGGATIDNATITNETVTTLNGATGSSTINLQHLGRTIVTQLGTNYWEIAFSFSATASYYVYTPSPTVSVSSPYSYTVQPSRTAGMTAWGDMAFKYYNGSSPGNYVFNFDAGLNTITYGDSHITYPVALAITDLVQITVVNPFSGQHTLSINGTAVATFYVTSSFIQPLGFLAQATQGTYLLDFSTITPGFIGQTNNMASVNNGLIRMDNNNLSLTGSVVTPLSLTATPATTGYLGNSIQVFYVSWTTTALTYRSPTYYQANNNFRLLDPNGRAFDAREWTLTASLMSYKYDDQYSVGGVETNLVEDASHYWQMYYVVTSPLGTGGDTMGLKWQVTAYPKNFVTRIGY